ncbi:MAG TPA: hypothetical protein VKA46_33605 [Gemmataceae bacterium]|nr:hypothetical protein [Gemmataceae bacterium]
MSVWDWIVEFNNAAEANGDRDRQRLLQIYENASKFAKTDPDVMLGLLAEGKALAQQLDEPWWVLFFDHWRLQALLHFKYDYRDVMDVAVQATLEARKPQYAELPQRVCLHEDLIYAYVGTDPEGHAERIGQALDYMQQHVGPDLDCRFCVQGCRAQFALQRGRLDEAQAASLKMLEMTDSERSPSTADHYALDAYADLCAVAFERGDWDGLAEWARAGEETARRRDKQLELAKFLAWRALLERRDGNEDTARRLFRAATSRAARLKAVPGESYYDALCAYHEQGGDPGAALTTRDQELTTIAGKGRLTHETRCRLKRCRLLAQMGLPLDEDLRAAREVAGKLRQPEKYLEEVDRLAGGKSG